MHSIRLIAVVAFFGAPGSALAQSPAQGDPPKPPSKTEPVQKEPKKTESCEPHGVKKTLCARCNPKLAPTFKAKGDWCAEHERPESQCVLCNPALATQGVK